MFRVKVNEFKNLEVLICSAVTDGQMSLNYGVSCYKTIGVYLCEIDYIYYRPLLSELKSSLVASMNQMYVDHKQNYQPVVRIFKTEKDKTWVSGSFDLADDLAKEGCHALV